MSIFDMQLQDKYFQLSQVGKKKVEIRLYDDKRKKLRVGDIIKFENIKNDGTLSVKITKLEVFSNFEMLFQNVGNELLGCCIAELKQDLEGIYGRRDSLEGVLAIYFEVC